MNVTWCQILNMHLIYNLCSVLIRHSLQVCNDFLTISKSIYYENNFKKLAYSSKINKKRKKEQLAFGGNQSQQICIKQKLPKYFHFECIHEYCPRLSIEYSQTGFSSACLLPCSSILVLFDVIHLQEVNTYRKLIWNWE